MPGLTRKTIVGSKMSWLGSTHGLDAASTISLQPTAAAWAVVVDAKAKAILAGTAVAQTDAGFVPWTGEAGQKFVGFLVANIRGDWADGYGVALLNHGEVRVSRLPHAFTRPAAEQNASTILFAA
jgi:hypothetical protein